LYLFYKILGLATIEAWRPWFINGAVDGER